MSNGTMNISDGLEGMWEETVVASLKGYFTNIHLE
jgi:hypothetical protein